VDAAEPGGSRRRVTRSWRAVILQQAHFPEQAAEHVHPRYQVPDRAVLISGAIAAVVAATIARERYIRESRNPWKQA
jgi:amino acid transporter